MPTRRLHSKSRNGCQMCKKRHVKCDESGPPCVNCAARNEACSYDTVEKSQYQHEEDFETRYDSSWTNRKLELELMHRWMSSTYKSLCSIPRDEKTMRDIAPIDGLQNEFLLDGILAFSALDLAVTTRSPGLVARESYALAAMRYYDRALHLYRRELDNLTADNHQAIFIFSILVAALHLGLLRCPPIVRGDSGQKTAFEAVNTLFGLSYGTGSIVVTSWDWLESGPMLGKDTVEQVESASTIDKDTNGAISRLHSLNDNVNIGNEKTHTTYKDAISFLEESFAKEADGSIKLFWLAWPGVVDRDFVKALRSSEPLALVILMHWSVLLHMASAHEDAWWLVSTGKDLASEIYEKVQPWRDSVLPEWKQAISWVRSYVGLTAPAEL